MAPKQQPVSLPSLRPGPLATRDSLAHLKHGELEAKLALDLHGEIAEDKETTVCGGELLVPGERGIAGIP